MARWRSLLLIPALLPLLAALLIGALNTSPNTRLRLLTWQTPAWPLGAWVVLASGGGSLLAAAGLLLAGPSAPAFRRSVRRPVGAAGEGDWPPPPEPERRTSRPPSPEREREDGGAWQGPASAPGEPPPTVAVPFRVLHRARSSGAGGWDRPTESAPRPPRPAASPESGADDWSDAGDDDW
ncbi:hypothetical protein EVJ50_05410 [Synechococcus sp. RSCCF101]|uniref:hypothetical protein n=1 Tax=Synechococcus sp. RSCCF101 TaxID=2511069 RepID=UPI0012478E42|nr:hypothetical protein [Synechococcus sp. RSCCF101]QEY31768.1 hypothetical protein EVJ50_05410 [Synechococcus sp. RSCCF101]